MVSLVTVRLGVFHFFLTFVLGGLVAVVKERLAVAALWVVLPPFEALTNFPPWVGKLSTEADM